jgi:hypothetical protein
MAEMTPHPWSLAQRGEDSQGHPLFDIVSESADLIVARGLWREDADAILEAVNKERR